MKRKILISTVACLGAFLVFAQEKNSFEEYYTTKKPVLEKASASEVDLLIKSRERLNNKINYKNNEAAPGSYFEYLSHTVGAIGYSSDPQAFMFFVNPLFQDSSVKYSTDQGTFNVATMKYGMILDPTSKDHFSTLNSFLTEDINLNKFQPYTLDSLFIAGFYNRVSNDTIVDTLQVEIVWKSAGDAEFFTTLVYGGSGDLANQNAYCMKSGVSTTSGNTSFVPDGANKIVKKIPLTTVDTVTTDNTDGKYQNAFGYPYIGIPIGQDIPAGNVVGVLYTFVPGYTYTSNDILFQYTGGASAQTINSFRAVVSAEEFSSNTAVFYDFSSTGGPIDLPQFCRYGKATSYGAATAVNGLALPSLGLGAEIYYGISADPTSVNELSSNSLKLWDNYPNPAQNETIINFELKEGANVSLSVYDITGKEVIANGQGKKAAGVHSINLNTSSLESGVYLYTLTAGQDKITKKMTVVK